MKQLFTYLLLLLSANAIAQNIVPPLGIPLYLSGNFGELRDNHFHSGIDFKTQGVTGIPVVSVKEGYVARINVSPSGYGRAIYINHPDGTTSVYAHLDKFIPRFEAVIKENQYEKETFALTLYFNSDELPVKQGEKIAYSGNTGSSGGPHLHFEIRETESEIPIDPLPFFKNKIKDTRPPEIRGLMIFPQKNEGTVNGQTKKVPVTLINDKSGKRVLKESITARGKIGVGIKAFDRMNETSNIYGVNEIILKVDGEVVYHSVMDRFSFDDTRYLNTCIDWDSRIRNREFYMKSFVEPGNRFGANRSAHNGIVSIEEEKDYLFEYTLKDVYENTSTIRFSIRGEKTEIPTTPEPDDWCLVYNRKNIYADKGITMDIPKGNLYSNVCCSIDTLSNYTPFAPLYRIGERIPLHTYCPLVLTITNDTYPDKSKYGVVHNWNGKRNWLGGHYINGQLKLGVRELGDFSIETDTIPPIIRATNETKWTARKRISFKITDNLSGIASYRGTLDGKFVLFEYDAKTNSLFCKYDSERMKTGAQQLMLIVADGAGNQSEFTKTIVF
jgi:hypothetical protein